MEKSQRSQKLEKERNEKKMNIVFKNKNDFLGYIFFLSELFQSYQSEQKHQDLMSGKGPGLEG